MHTTPASDLDKDVSGHNYMMHCFHVYAVAVGRFAHFGIKEELNEALHTYAIRLLRLPMTYRFESILAYYLAFVTAGTNVVSLSLSIGLWQCLMK